MIKGQIRRDLISAKGSDLPFETYIQMLENHSGAGIYDFKVNRNLWNDTFTLNGRKVRADQLGNYLAGYAGVFGGLDTVAAVHLAGQGYGIAESFETKKFKPSQLFLGGDDWGSVSMIIEGELDAVMDYLDEE